MTPTLENVLAPGEIFHSAMLLLLLTLRCANITQPLTSINFIFTINDLNKF